jgi:hypothetical protein
MNDSEPTFEILILPQETGAAPKPGTGKPGRLESLRPERWLYVTHLLVLLSLAGLVVCIVGLVRLSKSTEGHEPPAAGIARFSVEVGVGY